MKNTENTQETNKYQNIIDTNRDKYKDIYTLKVAKNSDATEFAIGILRKPTRLDMKPIMNKLSNDPLGAMEVLLQNCWLGGDTEILSDDDLFLGACTSLQSMIEVRYSEIKKN